MTRIYIDNDSLNIEFDSGEVRQYNLKNLVLVQYNKTITLFFSGNVALNSNSLVLAKNDAIEAELMNYMTRPRR